MHVRNRLARFLPVLNSNVETTVCDLALAGARRAEVFSGQHFLDFLDRSKEVCHFRRSEVCETLDGTKWNHEHVPWENRLDVNKGIA
jgi:hypothetical protein